MKKIFLLVLTIALTITLSGCVMEGTASDQVEFKLNGNNIVYILTGQSFVDPGFIAKEGTTDLTSYVTINGSVDTTIQDTYLIEYTLDYDNEETTLLRAVVVSDTEIIQDPDEVLYDGTCSDVSVHYIDLGAMGASTLIDCGDFEIIIDAGLKSAGTNVIVPYLNDFVDDGVIELVIATHPDADHIGGFVGLSGSEGIFDAFVIERILDYGYVKSTITHTQYAELRDLQGALVCSGASALNGSNLCQPYYTITDNLILRVIDTGHYDGEDTTNDNENSIVVLLEHGDNTFLFTGDAEHNAEAFMQGNLSHVDVYMAGHHGSHTANSEGLLNAITPTDIILSVDFPDEPIV